MNQQLPLKGIKILELSQNVMGPACGLILADLGAEVIRVEKKDGDDTRRLKGFARGFFPFYNRNKRSLCIDLKSDAGKETIAEMVKQSDVFIENFAPGTIERLGFGYDVVKEINNKIIFCSMKGFMPGPYEKRSALDEVIQMMSGLAYMTGPNGRPLRAGASILDVMGGSYAAMGIITALYERVTTGKGTKVISTLFESAGFLMGQHMAGEAITGTAMNPMPERARAWAVYDLFRSKDNEQIFIGITSDRHWTRFCAIFEFDDILSDERLITNSQRIFQRDFLVPDLADKFLKMTSSDILLKAEQAKIPFAEVKKPGDLFNDPQMNAEGNLVETELGDGLTSKLPSLPVRIGDRYSTIRHQPPKMNEGAMDILNSYGFNENQVNELIDKNILGDL
ncbi:MAG: formyl-CoA transferase [Denitrovibrio sp.]|nr:MAG: formyl-CoA transferase [Denitrovibrio sp.]